MPATNFTHGVKVGATVVTAAYSASAEDAGSVIVANAADLTITLPAAANAEGAEITVSLGASGLSTGTGLLVAVTGTDEVVGNGFTAAAGKGALLAGAGDRVGDSITFISDGVSSWFIKAVTGTWTRQA